jgi:hypothetical protein
MIEKNYYLKLEKLEKLDRIEYLLRKNGINNRYQWDPLIDNNILSILVICSMLLLLQLITKINFIDKINLILIFTLIYALMMTVINIFNTYFERRAIKELDLEFFNLDKKKR